MASIFEKLIASVKGLGGNLLGTVVGAFSDHAPQAVTTLQAQIAAGTVTKEGIKEDLHNIIATIKDFTSDEVDAILDTVDQLIDLAFKLEEQIAALSAKSQTPVV